jgi:hypothetical protein
MVFYPLGGRRVPSWREECSLCGRVFPTYSLRRCFRCGRLYCGSCITEDLVEGKYLVCLNCARRFASPKKGFRSKYTSLSVYLARRAQWTKWVKLTFAKIEEILGDSLPPSALQDQKWWNNAKSSRQGQAWLSVGWKVQNVDLDKGTVIFTRPYILKAKRKTRRKTPKNISLPKFKPRRLKMPSQTRIAKAQARLQNVARKKSSVRQYHGKFKPKPAYEKRLYKTEMKPAL